MLYLKADNYCPQCMLNVGNGGGIKAISMTNLKSDNILRSVIYKLVPGLYQKERERLQQFAKHNKNEANCTASSSTNDETSLSELQAIEDENLDFFSPTEPISLSLEFHPVLAEQCPEGLVPAIRYLQCPASVKVQHLKRFLCSKFSIDPDNRRVGIDIIYENEILPSDFTLMDVGYCYQWQRVSVLLLCFYNIDSRLSLSS